MGKHMDAGLFIGDLLGPGQPCPMKMGANPGTGVCAFKEH